MEWVIAKINAEVKEITNSVKAVEANHHVLPSFLQEADHHHHLNAS